MAPFIWNALLENTKYETFQADHENTGCAENMGETEAAVLSNQ